MENLRLRRLIHGVNRITVSAIKTIKLLESIRTSVIVLLSRSFISFYICLLLFFSTRMISQGLTNASTTIVNLRARQFELIIALCATNKSENTEPSRVIHGLST